MNYLHYSKTNNIGKVEMFHVLRDKVVLLMKRRYERGTKKLSPKNLQKGLDHIKAIQKMLVKGWIFYNSDKTDIRLPFDRSFSTFWHILWSLHSSFLFMDMG